IFFGDDPSRGNRLEHYEAIRHPADRDRVLQRQKDLLEKGITGDIEYRIIGPNGDVRWISGLIQVVREKDGRPARAFGTNTDITEKKLADQALERSRRLLLDAETLGQTGSWENDLVNGTIVNTEGNLRLFFGDD